MPPADTTPSPGQTWDFSDDTTLIRCLAGNAEVFPDRAAMREKSKGIWQEITWRGLLDIVLSFAAGLEGLGFAPGDTMLVVGDNRPYAVSDLTDFTIPVHGEKRGLMNTGIEIRQDLIADEAGQTQWAERLTRLLREIEATLVTPRSAHV